MSFKELNSKTLEVKREYRAVCYSKKGHWHSTWKLDYSEAYDEAEGHRNASPDNRDHDVRIIERVYSEKKLT